MDTSLWLAIALFVCLVLAWNSLLLFKTLRHSVLRKRLDSRLTTPALRPEPHIDKNVQFTVYRPATIVPEKWYPLVAFAHLSKRRPDASKDEPDPIKEVQRQAARILNDQPAHYESAKLDRGFAVPRKGFLTFVPLIEDCEFNPSSQSVRWEKTVHKVEFELKAPHGLDRREVEGQMTVYLGSILLTEVPLRISVDSQYVAPKSEQVVFEDASAQPYRKIFPSYSRRDTQIVEDFEDYIKALGDEYLRDVKKLRSGEVWSEGLENLIKEASVFQLFWSSNSMNSAFVKQEWEYALGLNRNKFIRPVYWEEPLPKKDPDLPPDTLKRIHFYQFRVNDTAPRSVEGGILGGISPPAHDEFPGGAAMGREEYLPQDTPVRAPAERITLGGFSSISNPLLVSLGLLLSVAGLGYLGYKTAQPGPSAGDIPPAYAINGPTPVPLPTPTTSPTTAPTPTPTLTPTQTPNLTPSPTAMPTPRVQMGQAAVSVAVDPAVLRNQGDSGSYYLGVRNSSSSVITNLVIIESLPKDLEYVGSNPKPVRQQGQVVVWRVPKISENGSATIKVTVRLRRALQLGETITTEQTITYTDAKGDKHTVNSAVVPIKHLLKSGKSVLNGDLGIRATARDFNKGGRRSTAC